MDPFKSIGSVRSLLRGLAKRDPVKGIPLNPIDAEFVLAPCIPIGHFGRLKFVRSKIETVCDDDLIDFPASQRPNLD